MTQPAAPTNCLCACHNTRGIEHPHGVDITDPFHAALACPDCFSRHDPTTYIEPTAWNPEDEQA